MKKILVLFALILLVSCKEKKSDSMILYEKKTEFSKILMKKYSTQYIWSHKDLYNKKFSIEFIDIVNSDIQLISNFYVYDIYNKSGRIYLLLEVGLDYIFELEVKFDQYQRIIKMKDYRIFEYPFILVVNIEQIRKLPITLTTDMDFIEGEDPHAYLDYVPSDKFYGKGYLINVEDIN